MGRWPGAILGVLIALAVAGADPRIRSLSDLRSAGIRSIEVDSDRPETVEALRALAEVGGIDAAGGAVALMTPRGQHSASLARALAESFVRSGRPTTLLSDSGAVRSGDLGWSRFGEGGGLLESLPRLRGALARSRDGEVTVIDAPALLERSGSLIATAVAAVTVLSLRRSRSTWSQLESSLELLEDAAAARACAGGARARRRARARGPARAGAGAAGEIARPPPERMMAIALPQTRSISGGPLVWATVLALAVGAYGVALASGRGDLVVAAGLSLAVPLVFAWRLEAGVLLVVLARPTWTCSPTATWHRWAALSSIRPRCWRCW